jgi:hypothetical protein
MTETMILPLRQGVTRKAIADGKVMMAPTGSALLSITLTIDRLGFSVVDLFLKR